jgi:hypothetical protein
MYGYANKHSFFYFQKLVLLTDFPKTADNVYINGFSAEFIGNIKTAVQA